VFDIFAASTSEDGGQFRLYVDDKLLLDDWTEARALVDYATLSLDAAPHKIVLEHRGQSNWLGTRMKLGIVRHGSIVDAEAKRLASMSDAVVLAVGFSPESESEGASAERVERFRQS
jgi:hypothetical protein